MKTIRPLVLIIFILQCAVYAYGTGDNSDRLSGASSSIFSPGYINAAKYQTEAILGQLDPRKSFMERLVENIKNNVGKNVDEDVKTKETVDIKKKTSSAPTVSKISGVNGVDTADPVNHNIAIGSGINQHYDNNNKLLWEEIGGVRHIYVGFSSINCGYGSIQEAIDNARADVRDEIILRGGSYSILRNITKAISIYGGYDSNGNRHWDSASRSFIDTSTINIPGGGETGMILMGVNNAVIDGLKFNSSLGLLNNTSAEVRFCTFRANGNGISINPVGNAPPCTNAVYIHDNTFDGNIVAGVSITKASNVTIERNTFLSNSVRAVYATSPAGTGITKDIFIRYNNFYTIGYAISINNDAIVTSDHNNFLNGKTMTAGGSGTHFLYSTNDFFTSAISLTLPNYGIYVQDTASSVYDTSIPGHGDKISADTNISVIKPINIDQLYSSTYNRDDTGYLRYLGMTDPKIIGNIMKKLLLDKDISFGANQGDTAIVKWFNNGEANRFALELGIDVMAENRDADVAMRLASILKNPTEYQKLIIDAITNLLKDIADAEGEKDNSDELAKAENDLLQVVAEALLTQGIPDLLKEGDVENLKGMFKDLGASKDKVLLDYKDSIKPYYNNIAKEIAANIAVLEIKGIVNKKLTEEELRKMEPREIDRILANIRKSNDKSFELEYILQQDSKYRKEYLDPSKRLMEDHMKDILGIFTKKLSEVLEEKK